MSLYTVLDDTFTGTTGSPITGTTPAPVACGTDIYADLSGLGIGAMGFAAGGGCKALSFGTASQAFEAYPLTGIAQDGTYTFQFTFTAANANAQIQMLRDSPGNNNLSITAYYSGGQLVLGQNLASVATELARVSFAWTTSTLYTLVATVASGQISIAVNGTALVTNQAVSLGSGTIILIGQDAASAGDVTFNRVKVQVAGPSSATVTGPTAITDGVASSNYTVTLSSAVPVGGAGIVFTPSTTVFSASPTPSTRTIAVGATTGTFTETASTTGTGVVSVTPSSTNITGLTVTGQSGVVASSGVSSGVYTALDETFTGTTGSALTGQGGAPVRSATDSWATFSSFASLVYAAGGGAVSALTSSDALSVYPLAGVASDRTIIVRFKFDTPGTAVGLLQVARSLDGANDIGIGLDSAANTLVFNQTIAGSTTSFSSPSFTFSSGVTYTATITISGTSMSVDMFDGTTTTHPLVGQAITTPAGSAVLIGQSNGPAGALTFLGVKVEVAGPASATVTGPTSLTVAVASSNYTITLGSAVPAGGAGIVFTPTATGFAGTGTPTTRTIASGATTGTFTETASSPGSGTVSSTASSANIAGLTVTGQSGVTASSGALAAGTATAGSTTSATAAATATDATGGTTPYTYQWYRSTSSGTLGSAVSGQTTRTLSDTGLAASTSYYYTLKYTDAASATVNSNQVTETTTAVGAPTGQIESSYSTASLTTLYYVITKAGGQAWNGTAFEAMDSTHWSTYVIAAADSAGVGLYLATMPGGIAAGLVNIYGYVRAGGSVAATDSRYSQGYFYWDATALWPGSPPSGTSAIPSNGTIFAEVQKLTEPPFGYSLVKAATSSSVTVADLDIPSAAPGLGIATLGGTGGIQVRTLGSLISTGRYAISPNWTVTPDTTTYYSLFVGDPLTAALAASDVGTASPSNATILAEVEKVTTPPYGYSLVKAATSSSVTVADTDLAAATPGLGIAMLGGTGGVQVRTLGSLISTGRYSVTPNWTVTPDTTTYYSFFTADPLTAAMAASEVFSQTGAIVAGQTASKTLADMRAVLAGKAVIIPVSDGVQATAYKNPDDTTAVTVTYDVTGNRTVSTEGP